MDWLDFRSVCFLPNYSIGQLCEDQNEIVGKGIDSGSFEIRNTNWLLPLMALLWI